MSHELDQRVLYAEALRKSSNGATIYPRFMVYSVLVLSIEIREYTELDDALLS